jgi:NADH-quinone oxidoreductase subunit D
MCFLVKYFSNFYFFGSIFKLVNLSSSEFKSSIKALIHHLKIFTERIVSSHGKTYIAAEASKREFSVYLISNNTKKPCIFKIKVSGFCNLQVLNNISVGHMIANVVIRIGMQNIVFREINR